MRVLWTVLLALLAAGVWAAAAATFAARDRAGVSGTTSGDHDGTAPAVDATPEATRDVVDGRGASAESSTLSTATPAQLPDSTASTGAADPAEPVDPVRSFDPAKPGVEGDLPVPPASGPDPTTPATPPDPAAFVMRGRGTELDPFRPTWDLLRSTEQTFKPGDNLREIPPTVSLLAGHVVRITGYFAAGVAEESTDELLVMFNRWDGCCLGLPPSPFDSVEVKLREPVVLRGQHMIRYGTITGRFEIEPFLVADWLIGLYRIVDAKLEWGGSHG